MSDFTGKAQNKADELGGKAKDVAGDLTDDSSLQVDGKVDQATSKTKQTAGQLGDAAQDTAENVVEGVQQGRGVVDRLHRIGVHSEWAYTAGFASVGIALGAWFLSQRTTGNDKSQSDRWGIFIGEWAPTFMALGIALAAKEDRRPGR